VPEFAIIANAQRGATNQEEQVRYFLRTRFMTSIYTTVIGVRAQLMLNTCITQHNVTCLQNPAKWTLQLIQMSARVF
jgi:hypothetical protein